MKEIHILIGKIGLLWCVLLSCIGCTKTLKIEPDSLPPQLEIKGTLSPQSGLEVIVRHTLPPYEWYPWPLDTVFLVENAEIGIYHQDTLVDVCRYRGKSFYQSRYPERILPGEEYALRVTAEEYPPVRVEKIRVPESPPEMRDFKLISPSGMPQKPIRDTLYFEVKNKPVFTVYRIDVRYEDLPLNEKTSYIRHFGEIFDPCEGTYYFTNSCFSTPWIPRKYQYEYVRTQNKADFFHISIIEPAVLDYRASGFYDSNDGFIEPPLHKGNLEGGFGYVVGENKVIIPIE